MPIPCRQKTLDSMETKENIHKKSLGTLKFSKGLLFDKKVSVLRDSGCSIVGCRKSLVPPNNYSQEKFTLKLIDGTIRQFPTAQVQIKTPYITGTFLAALFDDPVADVIIGNVGDATTSCLPAGAVTRGSAKRANKEKPLMPPYQRIDTVSTDLRQDQLNDPDLQHLWEDAKLGTQQLTKTGAVTYVEKNGLLYRDFIYHSDHSRVDSKLVVPTNRRQLVLETAHSSPLAGHMSIRRTKDRVYSEFFWPHVDKDIKAYVKSCPTCQKARPAGRVCKVELGTMEVIGTPFTKVAIDIVGPLQMTDRKNRYVLTLVDTATRWPEAIALKNITSEDVQEGLFSIFCRIGFPHTILSDNGPQFRSDIYHQVCSFFNIHPTKSSIYHPQSNGMVERFNGTLKSILRKVAENEPQNWDRFISAALFAYREIPNETTGISPYELVFGRKVRGPMSILKHIFTNNDVDDDQKPVYDYLIDLRNRLQLVTQTAIAHARIKQRQAKAYYDKHAKDKDIQEGDHVLILKPKKGNKLMLQWDGPYLVHRKLSKFNVQIKKGKSLKTYHVNRLWKFHERKTNPPPIAKEQTEQYHILHGSLASVVNETDDYDNECDAEVTRVPTLDSHAESVNTIKFNPELTQGQISQLNNLLSEFNSVVSDIPGKTNLGHHTIEVTSTTPITLKPYAIPYNLQKVLAEEIEQMLKLEVIEESNSPYAAPIVLVKKKDGTIRTCVDFRKLNSITKFVAEVIPDQEEMMSKLHSSKYFSKLDLTKGYWQIPLDEQSKALTAFRVPSGLYQFKYMPFGLATAPLTFNKIVRKLFKGMNQVITYFDDICIFSNNWEEHINELREVFLRLKESGFTVKPSKLELGYSSIKFLGHIVGEGILKPDPDNIDKILKLQQPKTKKQVRSLIGLASYYSKFIPGFATLTAPLTDLTKKGKSNKIVWTVECDSALRTIQTLLSSYPILMLPNVNLPFVVSTDASTTGMGACLMQERRGVLHPVKYISRKLLDRETRYSTIERECLAIVWAVKKLSRYLLGSKFQLQCDHKCLSYLQTSNFANPRICRWALALQEFVFDISYIKGTENVVADFLSRSYD